MTFHIKNKATINRSNDSTTAVRNGQLYVIYESENQTLQSIQSKRDDLLKWHLQYDRFNLDDLKELVTKNMVSGLNIKLNVNDLNSERMDGD